MSLLRSRQRGNVKMNEATMENYMKHELRARLIKVGNPDTPQKVISRWFCVCSRCPETPFPPYLATNMTVIFYKWELQPEPLLLMGKIGSYPNKPSTTNKEEQNGVEIPSCINIS